MASNLVSQLQEADALDRLNEVLEEIPATRKELGYPPLVTPMSQMVGTQAVSNVLFGRYKMISDQLKDYVYGLYGHAPSALDPGVVETALKDYDRGQQPTSQRPADLIEPELGQAREAIAGISADIEDVLTYALYPTTGLRFLKIKHGLEEVPDEMKPETVEQAEPLSPEPTDGFRVLHLKSSEAPARSSRARRFNVYVEDELFQVEIDPVPPTSPSNAPARAGARAQDGAKAPASAIHQDEAAIVAPMPGIVLRYVAEPGQHVSSGDPIVVLEAMKMENTLPSPTDGTVKSLPLQPGTTVAKDDILAVIARAQKSSPYVHIVETPSLSPNSAHRRV